MTHVTRLQAAFQSGLSLPNGPSLLLRPPPESGLAALFPAPVYFDQGFYPAHQQILAQNARPEWPDHPRSIIVFMTRHRAENQALVARALEATAPDGTVIVSGQKTDGVDPLLKALKKHLAVDGSASKAHGKVFWLRAPATLPAPLQDWIANGAPRQNADGYWTHPGMFSADKVDAGSALLVPYLDPLSGKVADLGAGWGYLSVQAAVNARLTAIDLYEAELSALEMAKRNLSDPRASFHWSDATMLKKDRYDWVISNPPFHTGRAAEPGLGQAFIRSAARLLAPHGKFLFVANRQLPYEATLRAHFRVIEELETTPVYKVIRAARPQA